MARERIALNTNTYVDPDDHLTCCERRSLLRGLGAAGLALMLGRCTTGGAGRGVEGLDRGLAGADGGAASTDAGAGGADTGFVGADGGLPPIDLAAPAVTQTATFALG